MTAQNRPDELIRILRAEFVTKPGSVPGGGCVTHTCASTGWRAEGGTTPRTLVHETAFQLDTGGNARGAYSVDLQYNRGADDEVASGSYSLNQGYRNQVEHDLSVCLGDWNDLTADETYIPEYNFVQGDAHRLGKYTYTCVAMGIANDIDNAEAYTGGQYLAYALGENHDFHEANYVFVFGSNNDVIDEAFGGYSFGENNDLTATGASDYPTYTGQYAAINCVQSGDVWGSLQVGEQNYIYDTIGTTANQYMLQVGYHLYAVDTRKTAMFGYEVLSHDPDGNFYLDGRIVHGEGVNSYNYLDPYYPGMNQSSSFSKDWLISTWSSSWTTAYQLPIKRNTLWYFSAMIAGSEYQVSGYYGWRLDGLVINASDTMYIAYQTLTKDWPTDTTKEWRATIDDANDRLLLQYRDTDGTDTTGCNIQMHMRTVEVGIGISLRNIYKLDTIYVGESVSVSVV